MKKTFIKQLFLLSFCTSAFLSYSFTSYANETLANTDAPTNTIMSSKLTPYHFDKSYNAYSYSNIILDINKTSTMGNTSYELGYTFSNVGSASFNLEGAFTSITGLLGCEDFKSSDGTVEFYLDGQLLDSFKLGRDQLPQPITLDVTGGSHLKVVFKDFRRDTQVNLVNPYIM